MRRRHFAMAAAFVLAMSMASATGALASLPPDAADYASDDFYYDHHAHQHGETSGHLEGSSRNVDVVGKLQLTTEVGDISDVSALKASNGKTYAYVGNWGAKCETGGVHVVDISNPASPVEVKFLNSPGFGYVTEGVQALSISTSAYTGDILVISNEWCRTSSNPKNMPGGITIFDINDPTNPRPLVTAFGDFDVHGTRANESHSAIAWDAGSRAFVAAIDNEELEDVDLFEITNPRSPVKLAETSLPGVKVDGHGELKTSHDFDVLRFPNGTWHLMVSDWDAGWVDVDVTNPAKPKIVRESNYADCDQVVPTACPPEGNAHQGEWTSTGGVFVGTDEDFDSYRTNPLTRVTGPGSPETYTTVGVGGAPVTVLSDKRLNGPVAYGGYGCPNGSTPIPAADSIFPPGSLESGEEQIVVLQRGPTNDPNNTEAACFPGEKADNATDQGWDAVILTGRHLGSAGADEPPNCGFGAFPDDEQIATVCTTHTAMHELFGRTPDYTVPYPLGDPGDLEPNIGEVGFEVDITATFDGWGYTRVLDRRLREISQITIPETADEDFGVGFGDLTVHEVEVPRGDPAEGGANPDTDKLAYFSWYAGGLRVVNISDPANPREVGHYIDPAGNNFWGVALTENGAGKRLVLASDRDYGLFIFKFTG
jgi:hypothetical protein